MKELQTVALGLVVVFLDVGSPDWVADPVGWLLVLVGIAAVKHRLTDYGYLQVTGWVCLALSIVTWPPDALPTLGETMDWLFTLPTLAFCFLLADGLTDATEPGLARRFRGISWAYGVVTVLPLLPVVLGWEWMPAQVLAVLVNVVLVLSLLQASSEDAVRAPHEAGTQSGDDGDDTRRAPGEGGKHKA